MVKRFNELERELYKLLVKDDAFGLAVPERGIKTNQSLRQYAFRKDSQKIPLFQKWLDDMSQKNILQYTRSGRIGEGQAPWTDIYITSSYKKGIERGIKEIKAGIKGIDDRNLRKQYSQSFSQVIPFDNDMNASINSMFFSPTHADAVGLIYTRAFTDLKGVTSQMSSRMSSILAQGLAEGRGPRDVARQMSREIGIAKSRARTIARTEVIRAHHEANINVYEQAGIEDVKIQAEWLATMDDRVCPKCASMNGKKFSLNEIRGMIPAHPNCLIDGQVNVFTRKGWKKIRDIGVGEFVMTHKGRFRKVTAVHNNKAERGTDCVRFGTKRWYGNWTNLSVTANHPILVGDRWISAGEVKIGDWIYLLASTCKGCGASVPWDREWCSRKCSSKATATEQWKNEDLRASVSRKNRESMIEQYRSGKRIGKDIIRHAHAKVAENILAGTHSLQKPEVHRKANQVLASLHNGGTWLEKRLGWALEQVGLKPIKGYAVDVGGRYRFPDFAFPEIHLAVEADGKAWHNKEKDSQRDALLKSVGWDTLRFSEERIDADLMGCAEEVLRLVLNHSGKYYFKRVRVSKLKKWKLQKARRTYNLTVEEDESYLAWGWIVHNCRCVALPVIDSKMDAMI